jgi:hypothetical protein
MKKREGNYLMKIDAYSFGRIVVDGRVYTSDIIIYPERVDPSWWRKEGHLLRVEDLPQVLALRPEVLVLGTGAYGIMQIPPDTIDHIAERGIEVIVQRTPRAVETFNALRGARTVVAALHLTC